jgi:hypothetical protein
VHRRGMIAMDANKAEFRRTMQGLNILLDSSLRIYVYRSSARVVPPRGVCCLRYTRRSHQATNCQSQMTANFRQT